MPDEEIYLRGRVNVTAFVSDTILKQRDKHTLGRWGAEQPISKEFPMPHSKWLTINSNLLSLSCTTEKGTENRT